MFSIQTYEAMQQEGELIIAATSTRNEKAKYPQTWKMSESSLRH
jgi:hypothetical protein